MFCFGRGNIFKYISPTGARRRNPPFAEQPTMTKKIKKSVSVSCLSVLCVFIIALCLFVIVFMLKLAKAQWRKHRSLIWIRVRGLVWRRISLCEQVFSMKMGQSGGLCEQMFNMQMRQSGVFVCLILKWVLSVGLCEQMFNLEKRQYDILCEQMFNMEMRRSESLWE